MKTKPKFIWTPERRKAQARNWATYKLSGMINNLATIGKKELEAMELSDNREVSFKLALYQALQHLSIAKQLIRKEYDK